MKKSFYGINIMLLMFVGLLSNSTVAQKSSTGSENLSIGGLLAYGTEIENLGIGVNAEFGITENLRISPSFIYYLPTDHGIIKTNWFELNANANYYFVQDDKFDFFGLGGLNYSSVNVKYNGPDIGGLSKSIGGSDGRFGLNLGAGANLHLSNDNITPFAELKYVIIDGGQLVIAAGVRFKI